MKIEELIVKAFECKGLEAVVEIVFTGDSKPRYFKVAGDLLINNFGGREFLENSLKCQNFICLEEVSIIKNSNSKIDSLEDLNDCWVNVNQINYMALMGWVEDDGAEMLLKRNDYDV